MANIEDVEIPTLLFDEQASNPTAPATGFWRAFFKADGLYVIDDAGVVTGPLATGGGGGGVGTVESAKGTRSSTTQPIGNASQTAMSLDTEVWDTDAMLDVAGANPTRITVQTAGKYRITGGMVLNAASGSAQLITIRKNGTDKLAENSRTGNAASGGSNGQLCVSVEDDASVSDYYELIVFTSGGATTLLADGRNFFSVSRFSD